MNELRPVPPFKCNEIERGKLHKEWEAWKRSLECYFESEDIIDQKKKRAKLLHLGGPQVQELFQTLPDSEKVSYVTPEKRYYDVAILAFDQFFKPVQQDVLERHKLRHMKQNQNERFAEFVVRVRRQINECGIERYSKKCRKILTDIMLTDAIVEGCRSDELRRRILQKDRSVDDIEAIGKSLEGVEQQVKDFGSKPSEESKGEVSRITSNHLTHRGAGMRKPSTVNRNPPALKTQSGELTCYKCGHKGHISSDVCCPARRPFKPNSSEIRCFKCGNGGHISTDTSCPAKGHTCTICNRVGHLDSQCRSFKRAKSASAERYSGVKKVRTIGNTAASGYVGIVEQSPSQSTPVERNADTDRKTYYAFYAGGTANVISCKIGGTDMDFLIDSGAEANLVTEKAWEMLKSNGMQVKSSEKGSDRILKGYASETPLVILGSFVTTVAVGSKQDEAQFFVVQGGQRNLLGDVTAKRLGVLWIGVNVDHVASKTPALSKISGIQVHIHMDPHAKPVFQPVRRLAVSLESAVNKKLDELLDKEVIEEKKGPVTWVSPLVVVGKANGEPRICLDLRRVNEAVQRVRHPMPFIDDFMARVGKHMIRSKLDIKDSFLQLELDEESRDIMVFITSRGMFRCKRVPFGLVTAPEIFQKVMDSILAGCEGTWWYIDDIYIEGRDKEEHDARLQEVLRRLNEREIQLNWDKCLIGVKELEFLGHKISWDGISPSQDKIESLLSFRRPENVNELRSFLGLANYLNRFLPGLATIDEPLRQLTKKGVVFEWTATHDAVFNKIKAKMVQPSALGFFKLGDRTLLMADASPTGLGAILIQVDGEGKHRIISYASKSLTDTEKRYCQTEKEALALVWSVEKFYIYLYGQEFELLTDCKALIYLFTHRSRPCARIERWVLRLQGFDYSVTHIPGDSNFADVLSRLATLHPIPFDEMEEIMIQDIASSSASAVAIAWSELVEASHQDSEIQAVLTSIRQNTLQDLPTEYKVFVNELCEVGGILIRADRIVVPATLRTRVLKIAHEGHLGMQMMKASLRSAVWWPKIDRAIEDFVKKCRGCSLVSAPEPPEPMSRKRLPSGPWEEIAIDFLGPLPEGQWLFVVVDYYSRFMEVVEMTRITARDTIRELATIFGRFGIPHSLRADNGPQLSAECEEFKEFCHELGIKLVNTTPYWPQANGEVERQNRTILKRLRIANELGRDWRLELSTFLLAYHSTNHTVTGRSPSELMFGRRIRSKLPIVPHLRLNDEEMRDKDGVNKNKGKEYADGKRRARSNDIITGDFVYVKRMKKDNKLCSDYSPVRFKVVGRSGAEVTIQSTNTGKQLKRNVAHLKKVELDDAHQQAIEPTSQMSADIEESLDVPSTPRIPAESTVSGTSSKRIRVEPKKFSDYIPY